MGTRVTRRLGLTEMGIRGRGIRGQSGDGDCGGLGSEERNVDQTGGGMSVLALGCPVVHSVLYSLFIRST